MKLYYQSACRLVILFFFCVLLTVRHSDSTFVPGRCLCPHTQAGVRGQVIDLTVSPRSPSCNKMTVIVTLKANNRQVCLSPEGAMGKQLIRCWNRAHKANRSIKPCLKRKRRGRSQRSQQKSRHQNGKASS